MDRSTPVGDKPPSNVLTTVSGRPTLRLQTQTAPITNPAKGRGTQTPYLGPLLDTPLTAQPDSPQVVTAVAAKDHRFPSSITMNATPPMSAVEQSQPQNFDNATTPVAAHRVRTSHTPITPSGARRRTTLPSHLSKLPYTHPRSLRSILRNSPLPPLTTTKSPISPRRQSARLQEKALRHVAYNSPLEQTITTSKYTVSHIDLLAEDATPTTPSQSDDSEDVLDQTMAYTGNETRDGGQTPGPFEEMRRRMAGLQASTPGGALSPTSAGGIRKRGAKRKEKKRRWVWTIGRGDDEDGDGEGSPYGAAVARGECGSATPAPMAAPVMLVAAPTPKRDAANVPVLAVPAPRPRTRKQVAMATAAGNLAVPVIATPTPPARTRVNIQVSSQQPQTLVPPVVEARPRVTTPEPVTAVLAPEPPTPSLSVASSTADPVFEPSGDVEMSDASSMCSEATDCNYGTSGNIEMDVDTTPVTARPVVFKEANRGWAPWIGSSTST